MDSDAPPADPEDLSATAAAPRLRPPAATWKWLLGATLAAAVLVAAGVYVFGSELLKGVPASAERRERTISMDNVKLLTMLQLDLELNRMRPPVGGKRFVLWPFVTGTVDPEAPGALEAFFSPADRGALSRARLSEYRALTRERLMGGDDVGHMTSYVGPRLGAEGAAPEPRAGPRPILADLHFEDGAIVGFADGLVEWRTREQLGLAPGDPIVAGPTSKSPILRQLSE